MIYESYNPLLNHFSFDDAYIKSLSSNIELVVKAINLGAGLYFMRVSNRSNGILCVEKLIKI